PPKNAQPSNDPDAGFAKRQGKSGPTSGYKAHMGVDEGSGLIRAVLTTPANVNDTTPADDLIRGDEAVVWADAAYDTHARPTNIIPTCRPGLSGTTASLREDARRWRPPLPRSNAA